MRKDKREKGEVSRRDFLIGAGAVVVGGAVGAGITYPLVAGREVEVETKTVEISKTITKTVPTTVTNTITVEEPVIPEAIGYIVHDRDLCAGCLTCMAVCSLYHHGAVSTELSGIQVVMFPIDGGTIDSNTCLQCKAPECVYICPEKGAIYVDEVTGARVIDQDLCIGCRLCQLACPHRSENPYYSGDGLSPIRYDAEKNVCFKCDLCGGDPQCVKFCPQGALSFSTMEV